MISDLKDAIRSWEREVDREAIELIEAGVAPYDAIEKAKGIVSARRRDKRRGRTADPSGQQEDAK